MKNYTISIVNPKGGVSKSTTAIHLSFALSNLGKTLLIDFDPQGDSSLFFFPKERPEFFEKGNVYTVIKKQTSLAESIRKVYDFHLLPFIDTLSDLVVDILKGTSILNRLWEVISGAEFEFVIIDTPGNYGIETLPAYIAADVILIPMSASSWAIRRFGKVMEKIEEAKRFRPKYDPKIYILPSDWPKTQDGDEILSDLKSVQNEMKKLKIKISILDPISRSRSIKRHTEKHLPLPEGKGPWLEYKKLAESIVNGSKK